VENNISRQNMIASLGVLGLALLPLPSMAQSSRIAVFVNPTDRDSAYDMSRFESRLGGALLRTGNFSLVDRSHIEQIKNEIGFSNDPIQADPRTAAKFGKLAGAQAILFVQFTTKFDGQSGAFVQTVQCEATADFKLIDVATASVTKEGSADGDAENKGVSDGEISTMATNNLKKEAIDSCIDDLIQQITG
jgi:curli biogenesis system outer membrane secretion channel CsgG